MTGSLHVDDPGNSGPGPLVVLVHGAMDRSTSFARTARLLTDLAVLRYDRRGYGRSADCGTGTLSVHVADLLELVGDREAVVVGHSFGGTVALAAAAVSPRHVVAAGAYEPPTPWLDWWPRSARPADMDPADAAEGFIRRHVGDDIWRRLPPRWKAARRAEGHAMVTELRSIDGPGAPFEAEAISVPVVVGLGTESAEHHRRGSEATAAAIPGARLVVVQGAGHDVPGRDARAYAAFTRTVVAAAAEAPRPRPA